MVQYSRSCLPLAVGFAQLWTQSRIQPSWPTTNPPPFWSSQVPWAHAVGGHASKDKQCENSKSILVKMTLKKGTMRGKVLNMWCPIWVCWVNISLIPKQNTGKVPRQGRRHYWWELAKSHFFPLFCSGETHRGLSAHGKVCFPSNYKSFLSFQISSFFKKTFWSAISISF